MDEEKSEHENTEAAKESKPRTANKTEEKMDGPRVSEASAVRLLADCNNRIWELEAELKKTKESEAKFYDSLVIQTEQLNKNKVVIEDSKLEIASLQEKIKALQLSSSSSASNNNNNQTHQDTEESGANEKALLEEIRCLKNELKLATEAEENSAKAMEDLALALKEVATESNMAKEKLCDCEEELEQTTREAERLTKLLENSEDRYRDLQEEADRYKNTAERLRSEAEESLAAWSGRETEFVNCIRNADEERIAAKKETARLLEKIRIAENRTLVAKEENQKLRDILKQALNEANAAKEAAAIAQAENSQLKDALASREEALWLLAQENEILKIHEAAAFENIKELKRMLVESSSSSSSTKNSEDKEKSAAGKAADDGDGTPRNGILSSLGLNLRAIRVPAGKQNKEGDGGGNEDTDETLKGSILDESTTTPVSGTPHHHHHHHHDGEMLGGSLDFDHLDDDMGNSRKRRALLRRFSDLILIRRRAYPRKESAPVE